MSNLAHIIENGSKTRQFNPKSGENADQRPPTKISATPFAWVDPATLPLRPWIYGRFLIRKFVSLTIAPGAVGKSSLGIVDALAMCSGRKLVHDQPHGRYRVWLWNGEDPLDELQRRVMAAAIHYEIKREDLEGWLYLDSGRQTEIKIADMDRGNVRPLLDMVEGIKRTIRERQIDAVVIDPFVSSHGVSENDNVAIDRVAKLWNQIADETACAVHIIHHARKSIGLEVEVEHARGAIALSQAARKARTLNTMSKEEAEKLRVDRRHCFFRVTDGKPNLAPISGKDTWIEMQGVPLGNGPHGSGGDEIGVATPWSPPDPMAGVTTSDLDAAQKAVAAGGPWRHDAQAKTWVGKPIAESLGLDIDDAHDKQKVKGLLKTWVKSGAFKVVRMKDAARREREFVEVGSGPEPPILFDADLVDGDTPSFVPGSDEEGAACDAE